MGNVVQLSATRQKQNKKNDSKKKRPPSAQTIKLWHFSFLIDDVVKQGVLEQGLPPDEIAAILAHRLGTLLTCCEKSAELSEFCCGIIERMNTKKVPKSGETA